jgi:hypothetical protein
MAANFSVLKGNLGVVIYIHYLPERIRRKKLSFALIFRSVYRPPGEAVDGCSGCLATLRRGSGGAPSYRSHSVA